MSNLVTQSNGVDERQALVARICASRTFLRTVRLRELLLHITQLTLQGRAGELSETQIARHVFARGDDFVPVDDSVVRSSARQLRLKLKEYFDGEGRDETWRVEVPRGSYVPVFTKGVHPPSSEAGLLQRRSNWLMASLAANVSLVAVTALLLWAKFSPNRSTDSLVSAFLQGVSAHVPIVVSDFSLAGMRHLVMPANPGPLTLDHYVVWDYSPLTPGSEASGDARRAFELFRSHRLTRSGDLALTVRLLQATGIDPRMTVRHARDVSARELRSGSHILLGNPNTTPWAEPYEARLGFRWLRGRGYRDLLAKGGEPESYLMPDNSFNERGMGYGRLAVLPNLSGLGQVLLLSGINMVTMEAAGEAAVNPSLWSEIRGRLGIRESGPLPAFEVLLETEAVDNTPQHSRMVKARLLSKGNQADESR